MDIKDVQYITRIQLAETDTFVDVPPYFEITRADGIVEQAPANTDNRHYWEVKEWYGAQEVKPFEFEFEELPEPVFAETIYPPQPEESEEVATEASDVVPVEPTILDEPETLMPR